MGRRVNSKPPRTPRAAPPDRREPEQDGIHAPLAELIGRTRYVVIVAVAAVLLVAMALFILGAGLAVGSVWKAAQAALRGDIASTDLTVEFLEVVSFMLKAVIFYIIGVGLYSLFIAPLNVTTALGVETFNDLEIKIVSVIIVIMGVTYLEHFIVWQQPVEMLLFGASLAIVVAALVYFSNHVHRSRQDLQREEGSRRARAQQELFEEEHEVRPVELTDELQPPVGRRREEPPEPPEPVEPAPVGGVTRR